MLSCVHTIPQRRISAPIDYVNKAEEYAWYDPETGAYFDLDTPIDRNITLRRMTTAEAESGVSCAQ